MPKDDCTTPDLFSGKDPKHEAAKARKLKWYYKNLERAAAKTFARPPQL